MAEEIPDYTEWWNRCKKVKLLLDDYDDTEGNKLMKKFAEVLPENPTITVDIGQTVCWAAQSLWLKGTKGRIIIGGSYGAMGIGLPYAIGSSISNDKGILTIYCIRIAAPICPPIWKTAAAVFLIISAKMRSARLQ